MADIGRERDTRIKTPKYPNPVVVHVERHTNADGKVFNIRLETEAGDSFFFADMKAAKRFLDAEGCYTVDSPREMERLREEKARRGASSAGVLSYNAGRDEREVGGPLEAGILMAGEAAATERLHGEFRKSARTRRCTAFGAAALGAIAVGGLIYGFRKTDTPEILNIDPVHYLETGDRTARHEVLATVSPERKKELTLLCFEVRGETAVYQDKYHFLRNNDVSLETLVGYVCNDLVPGAQVIRSMPLTSSLNLGEMQGVAFTIDNSAKETRSATDGGSSFSQLLDRAGTQHARIDETEDDKRLYAWHLRTAVSRLGVHAFYEGEVRECHIAYLNTPEERRLLSKLEQLFERAGFATKVDENDIRILLIVSQESKQQAHPIIDPLNLRHVVTKARNERFEPLTVPEQESLDQQKSFCREQMRKAILEKGKLENELVGIAYDVPECKALRRLKELLQAEGLKAELSLDDSRLFLRVSK